MAIYEVGFILVRCHIQKRLKLSNSAEVIPLGATGFRGDIHTARDLLNNAGFTFTRNNLEATLNNFRDTGYAAHLKMPNIEAPTFEKAIELSETLTPSILGALAVTSANPVVLLCAYAKSQKDSGTKFYVPSDRKIFHATNIDGFLDTLPVIDENAKQNPKLNLLLRLYRASLRETEIDYQLLFQLILFEEASDEESGTLAERVRKFSERIGLSDYLNSIAEECSLSIPAGKDMVDVIVKLRNTAAHNGKIDADGLKEYGGDWIVPLLINKSQLHKAVGEVLRYMFRILVGHSIGTNYTLVTGPLEIKFD